MNADKKYGADRLDVAKTAPDSVSPQLAKSPQYQHALAAARTAFVQQHLGTDPTGGRVFFNNRFNDYQGPRLLGGASINIFKRFGPFSIGGGPMFTLIYNDPK